MTKKGPLSKAEKFYIEGNLSKPMEDLCKDLDRAKSSIEKHIKSIPVDDKEKAETLLFQQFARNEKGSTVMTENASSMSDDVNQKRSKFTNSPPRSSKCTTKIR